VRKILLVAACLAFSGPAAAQSQADTAAVLAMALDTVVDLHFDRATDVVHINRLVLHQPELGVHVSVPTAELAAQTLGLPTRLVPYSEYDCFTPEPGGRRVCRTVDADGMVLPNLRRFVADTAVVYVYYDKNTTLDDGSPSAYRSTHTILLTRAASGWAIEEVGWITH